MSDIAKDIEILNELLLFNNLKLEEKDINTVNSLISEGVKLNLNGESIVKAKKIVEKYFELFENEKV